jgi:hypothetical protein
MTFLAPAMGLIGAAIGVPLLIALYLLKLRRKPLKVSSTLLWEQAVQDMQANVPLRWLRWSWLLALQLIVLACLLAALARPAVPGTAGIAARTVIVMDCSASMSARDGKSTGVGEARTRLDEAKEDALALIEQMRRASGQRAEGMIVAMGASARVVRSFTSDTRELRDGVQAVQPTDQPANLDEVVRIVAAAALAGSDGNSLATRTAMVVFSDGSLDPARERLPGNVDLRLVRVGPEPARAGESLPDNLGIIAIGARRDAENPSLARVFVRVANAGEKPVETTLTCSVDGEAAGLLPLNVPAATVGADGITIPGEAAGTFQLDRPAGGLVVVSIPRADLLSADNTAGVVLRPVSKPRILVVGPNEAGDPYAAARGVFGIDRFLLGALQDIEPGELKPIDAASYRDATLGGALASYDLIIFDRVTPTPPLPAISTISIGANLPGAGLRVEPLDPSRTASAATRFISWKRTHPVLKNSPLDAVLVSPPMQMTIDEPPRDGGPVVTPLAFGASGPLIALVQEPGVRGVKRLILAFDLVRTNWGQDVSFPVFVSSAVDFLTGRGESAAGRAATTAEAVTVIASPGAKRVHVSGAETFDVDVPGSDTAGAAVSLGVPRLAGVYKCEGTAPGFETIVANVTNPRETALSTRSAIAVGGRESLAGTQHAGDAPKREVWHWFVLAAMALLTIEWFIHAWRSRP